MKQTEDDKKTENKKSTEAIGWFSERAYSTITQEKISLARNMCLGSAGLSVLAIFRLSLATEFTISLNIALYAFSVATPLFMALAFWYEIFIWLGEKSFDYLASKRGTVDRLALAPMLALFIGVFAIIWHLSIISALIFLTTSVLALIILERNMAGMREIFDKNK